MGSGGGGGGGGVVMLSIEWTCSALTRRGCLAPGNQTGSCGSTLELAWRVVREWDGVTTLDR